MKLIIPKALSLLVAGALLLACDSKRSNTKAENDATYVDDQGDTINPMEGEGEGTAGHKYMETQDADSSEQIDQ